MLCACLGAALLIPAVSTQVRGQQQVREYVENGQTWRETRYTVRQPVAETQMREQQRTVYREQRDTEVQKSSRTCWVPVTEYRWRTRWAGFWPFERPYPVREYVPYTRWEPRQEEIEVPVTRVSLVPETRTEQVPVMVRRFEEREIVSRVAVGRAPQANLASQTATPERRIGGVARLENDPPRQGFRVAR